MKFDPDIPTSVELEDTARPIPVEAELRVCVVVDEDRIAPSAKLDGLLEVVVWSGRSGRVVGIIQL